MAKIQKQPGGSVFRKIVLKICSKFTRDHPCRSVISIKMLCNFLENTLWHGWSPVNLLHIFKTLFYNNTFGIIYFIAGTSFNIMPNLQRGVKCITLVETKDSSWLKQFLHSFHNILSGISFNAKKAYANIPNMNACKKKCILLIINWREQGKQDIPKIWILFFFLG